MDVAWDSHHLDRYTSHNIPLMLCAATGSATRLRRSAAPPSRRTSALRRSDSLAQRCPSSSGPGARSALTRVAVRPRERESGELAGCRGSGRQQAHRRLSQSRRKRAAGVADHEAGPSRVWRCSLLANRRCAAVRRNRPAPVSARSTMGLADSKELVHRWDSSATAVPGVGGARPAVCCSAWVVGIDRPVGVGVRRRLAAGGGDSGGQGRGLAGERGAARSRSAGAGRCGVSRLLAYLTRASRNVID